MTHNIATLAPPPYPGNEGRLKQMLAFAKFFEDRKDYAYRNICVMVAVSQAALCGMAAGYRIDPSEPEWPVALIELPTGQVSWHVPQFPVSWDGHDTEEKYRRVQAYLDTETGEQA